MAAADLRTALVLPPLTERPRCLPRRLLAMIWERTTLRGAVGGLLVAVEPGGRTGMMLKLRKHHPAPMALASVLAARGGVVLHLRLAPAALRLAALILLTRRPCLSEILELRFSSYPLTLMNLPQSAAQVRLVSRDARTLDVMGSFDRPRAKGRTATKVAEATPVKRALLAPLQLQKLSSREELPAISLRLERASRDPAKAMAGGDVQRMARAKGAQVRRWNSVGAGRGRGEVRPLSLPAFRAFWQQPC